MNKHTTEWIKHTESYGSSPIIFIDERKQKEWDEAPEDVKRTVKNHLHHCIKEMSIQNSLEILAHCINDLHKRLDKMESHE